MALNAVCCFRVNTPALCARNFNVAALSECVRQDGKEHLTDGVAVVLRCPFSHRQNGRGEDGLTINKLVDSFKLLDRVITFGFCIKHDAG